MLSSRLYCNMQVGKTLAVTGIHIQWWLNFLIKVLLTQLEPRLHCIPTHLCMNAMQDQVSFLYWKRQKGGWGLGTRLSQSCGTSSAQDGSSCEWGQVDQDMVPVSPTLLLSISNNQLLSVLSKLLYRLSISMTQLFLACGLKYVQQCDLSYIHFNA